MKTNKTKPGLGENHFEKQLISQHKAEIIKYLIKQGYTAAERKIILAYYNKNINFENIIKVHTHQIAFFLEHLCTGKLAELYNQTTCSHELNAYNV